VCRERNCLATPLLVLDEFETEEEEDNGWF
jgi:hypothetical protein